MIDQSGNLMYSMLNKDTRAAVRAIEDAVGVKVFGYRAPSWSITKDCLWALDVLAEEGFTYDSRIYPIHPARIRNKWKSRVRQYTNLPRMEQRLQVMLQKHQFQAFLDLTYIERFRSFRVASFLLEGGPQLFIAQLRENQGNRGVDSRGLHPQARSE